MQNNQFTYKNQAEWNLNNYRCNSIDFKEVTIIPD